MTFTQEDVEALRQLVEMFRQEVAGHDICPTLDPVERDIMYRVLVTADKIASHVSRHAPPRGPSL